MTLFKIAFRNILRNARRSLLTASAIAVGAIAMIVFGQYMGFVVKGFETGVIERDGHLSVFHKGYFDFGAGNPGAYSIAGYRSVIGLIKDDPVLRPLINVVTPTVTLYGIAGNFAIDASKTFLGVGVVPADRERMLQWDEFGINAEALNGRPHYHFPLKEGDPTDAVLGIGLARMLGLCKPLRIANCPSPPQTATTTIANAPPPDVNLAELAARDRP
ncbi:MAG: ABC transporter permease, partial [Alphaproteobacteria bacterium]|nr:ABC transporter permease [Alphaproteobacteria bacterium]